jgi:hypothetical protein
MQNTPRNPSRFVACAAAAITMMRASARFSRFVWRPATCVRFVWTAAGRAVSLILGGGLHGSNAPERWEAQLDGRSSER